MRPIHNLVSLLILIFATADLAAAQDAKPAEPEGTPKKTEIKEAARGASSVKLEITRRFLKNFLTDEDALAPYSGDADEIRDMPGAFMIGAQSSRYVVIWDPEASRLLGVLDLKAKAPEKPKEKVDAEKEEEEPEFSPYTFRATGPQPFQSSSGAFGDPSYFGFRVLAGKPVFLYTLGSLMIEETLWLEEDGTILKQKYSVRDPQNSIKVQVPEDWKKHAESNVGEWTKNVLSVPAEKAGEIVLTYNLELSSSEEENE